MVVVFQSGMNPDMGFALDFPKEHYQKGKQLAEIGWDAWWYSTHSEDWEDESILTREDVESCYDLGYMEMALDLLYEAKIPYKRVKCFDEEGNFNADMIKEWEDWL